MIEWTKDAKGRPVYLDPEAGALYRLSHLDDGRVQLAVFPDPAKRSCDRVAFASMDQARLRAEQRLVDDREIHALGRASRAVRTTTPWGSSRLETVYAEGLSLFSTATTDAFHLSSERNGLMPKALRSADGWYREDAAGAQVALLHPELFTTTERREAEEMAQEWDDELRAEFGLPSLMGLERSPGSP